MRQAGIVKRVRGSGNSSSAICECHWDFIPEILRWFMENSDLVRPIDLTKFFTHKIYKQEILSLMKDCLDSLNPFLPAKDKPIQSCSGVCDSYYYIRIGKALDELREIIKSVDFDSWDVYYYERP